MKRQDLFGDNLTWQIDALSIDISSFADPKNDNNEWLKSSSRKITLDAKPIFDVFFKANDVKPSEMPQYYCSPYWCDATSNFKWRYLIVSWDGDYFLVFLRIVGIMYRQQYFSVSYDVLSLGGYKHKAAQLLETIRQMDSVKSVEKVFYGDVSECDNANYYCDKESVGVMNKNRRNKYKRALSLKESGLTVKVFTQREISVALKDTSALYDVFQSSRFKFNTKSANKLLSIALDDNNCCVYGFYYNDVLVGVQMVTNDFLNCAYIHFAKDITSLDIQKIVGYVGCDENVAQRLKNFLGTFEEEYLKNEILVNNSFDALFVDGFHSENPNSLVVHKQGFYPKHVLYKIEKT